MKKWLLIGAILLVGFVAWSFRPQSIAVETVIVERGALEEVLSEEGRTRVRERYPVLSPVHGTLQRVTVEPGDAVVAGETIIATIDPPAALLLDPRSVEESRARIGSAEATLTEAEARVEQAEEQRRLAEAEYTRLRDLVASGDATLSARDAAERTLRALEGDARRAAAAITIAEQDLRGARATFARTVSTEGQDGDTSAGLTASPSIVVRAPVSGRVLRVVRETEGPITQGALIVEIGDLSALEVVADYLTTDAVQIEPGMAARLEGWGGAPLPARVRRVEPSGVTQVSALGVEEQRVDVILDLEPAATAAATGLGDGFRVEVRVVTWSSESVLRVPEGALFRSTDGSERALDSPAWTLFRLEGGKAIATPVRGGHRDGRHAEILEGVREGETIVNHPPDAVGDGTRIRDLAND